MSRNSEGEAANHASSIGAVSADGRCVAFLSQASNLVAGDTNHITDVFVRDMVAGTTVRVNVSSSGAQANATLADFSTISISGDGQRIAFVTYATNLDAHELAGVFVHDRADQTTRRVSVATGGAPANGLSRGVAISGDGRYVAFLSHATNLVADDTNGKSDVFVHDLVTGRTERVSIGGAGQQGNSNVGLDVSISGDGRFVAFVSSATNLVPSGANSFGGVFLRDRASGVTELISVNHLGWNADRGGFAPDVSDDGRYVSFLSSASDLAVPPPPTETVDVYLRDRASGTTRRINLDTSGLPTPWVRSASISGDGRFVAFWREMTPTLLGQVWIYDQLVGHAQPVNVNRNGVQEDNARGAAISADGRWVGFASADPDFDANDTNADVRDAFLWDRFRLPRAICAADQATIACPCAPPSTVPFPQAAPGHGCANSKNASGAVLHGFGSLVPDELRFRAEIAPLYGGFAFLIRGDTWNADGLGAGDGIRCVTGNLVRFGAHLAGTNGDALGEWSYPNAVQTTPVTIVTAQNVASSAYYQVVYRDVSASFCNPSTFNVTSALEVVWP